MAELFINFDDNPVGEFPAGFSSLSSGKSFSVELDKDSSNGKALFVSAVDGNAQVVEFGGLDSSGVCEAVIRVKITGNKDTDLGMGFGPIGSTSRVQTTLKPTDSLRIGYVDSGFKEIEKGFPFTPEPNIYHFYKFQWAVGSDHLLRAKAWVEVEPEEWVSVNTPLTTLGFSEGVLKIQGYRHEGFYIDWVGVGTDGDQAPTEPKPVIPVVEPSKPLNLSTMGAMPKF